MDDIDTLSSGSPDLGDVWRQGCPESPEWESELELGSVAEHEEGNNAGSADENEDEGLEDYLKQVIESPLWVLVRDFLSSADVLEMRSLPPPGHPGSRRVADHGSTLRRGRVRV